MSRSTAYTHSQLAIAELKASVPELLELESNGIMTNAKIGRALGIYQGHKGHEGHISRTILGLMETDGTVEQFGKQPYWRLRQGK